MTTRTRLSGALTRSSWAMLLGASATLAGCARRSADDASDAHTAAVVAATVATVTSQPFVETIGALGVVQPRAGHVASLSAPGPTRIASVLVAVGDHVTSGERLIAFEAAGFEAGAQSANAAIDAARRARERAARLVAEGIAAHKDLEQADADLARARADSIAAQRIVDLAVLRAPFAGVITRLGASIGASADVNQSLIEIADPAALDVILTVTPADAARVRRGDTVTIQAPDGGAAHAVASGAIADVGGAVDSASHGVPVRVEVQHSQRELRIGESVTGVIAAATRARALTVPVAALVPEGDGFQVFVVDSTGVAHARAVTLGGRTDSMAEITSGLRPGERIVTQGAFGVDDGAHIAPPKP